MSGGIRVALIGAGGFARFAVSQFVRRPGVQLVAAFDPDPAAIDPLRRIAPGVRFYRELAPLLADPAVDLVYIGSPPFLHHAQSLAALLAGKHVICEKPAALTVAEAQQLRAVAAQRQLLFVVNLMQRYNPLYGAVKALVQRQLLGEFLHGFFENYASDEMLPPNHWFWDERKSGGLFIEHGVHFFDMFAGWLGAGRMLAAQKFARPGHPGLWDLAQCDVVHAGNAPVRYYHGFNQPRLLDRQEMRLQFERGEATLFEWVPTRLVIKAVCTTQELAELQGLFPQAQVEVTESFEHSQQAHGRFKPVSYECRIHLDTGQARSKTDVYESLVARMFDDQLDWLADRTRTRTIDADNAVDSLAMAEQAERMALRVA